jgi:hypothetical protein
MPAPNLFTFATSELSQDAFICWLASWADPSCRELNGPLHKTATAFLDRLLDAGKGPKVPEYRSIEIHPQWNSIDVLIVVNGDTAIIVEDKTNTKDHSDPLRRYKEAAAQNYPKDRITAVYLKTGDQCDYEGAQQAGYGCFLRRDFLDILEGGKALGITNAIFIDFHSHLQDIEKAVASFRGDPLDKWDRKQWMGFFTALRSELGDGEWAVRGHGGGGSLTFRWHRRGNKYLRLDEGELAFCLEVADAGCHEAEWEDWAQKLMAENVTGEINLHPTHRNLGRRMRVAVLGEDYRQQDGRGLLDLDRTIEMLRKAEMFMDAALTDS